ncbi:MAG: TetR/AcrR family transcriptional regulator [Actinomycetota bacterium]|nr:TetR/AcrR family transcriptional regulator [Actinomycetota bacterium]
MTTPAPLGSRARPADRLSDGQLRRAEVLEVAARLLAQDGPHGLSLRRVAAAAGGSTQLIYTLFGGKAGLADALYAEGFQRLGAQMRAALCGPEAAGDPARLLALGRGYRQFARCEPSFFAVMFGRSIPGFSPARQTRLAGRDCTFGQVVNEVAACLAAGTLVAADGDAEDLARIFWATAHGVAALEVAGLLAADDLEVFVERTLRVPLTAHLPR